MKKIRVLLVLLVLASVLTLPVQSVTALKDSKPSSTVDAITPQAVEAFVNGFASYAL